MDISELDLTTAHKKLLEKEVTSVELTEYCLDRIKKHDSKVKAFVTVSKEEALEEAAKADQMIASEERSSYLTGVPYSAKDVIMTEGLETTASSNILKGYKSSYDATGIKKIKKQGGVLLGKTNCDAFAHGASTENSDFFVTKNPWDQTRVPGGSSGGSAASVAAGEAFYSLGTDTGGSIRQPASFCGLVGLKPTYGRVSRNGLISMTSSTDCLSIVTRDINDAAVVLENIAGEDIKDATCAREPVPSFSAGLRQGPPSNFKIGLPKEFFEENISPEVQEKIEQAIKQFKELGAEIVEVNLPSAPLGVAVYYILTPSELSSNLERFDGIRYGYSAATDKDQTPADLFEVYTKTRGQGFGDEAKRRIMMGTFALSSGYFDAYYLKASKVRTIIIKEFKQAFKEVDVLLSPTSPHLPFKIGEQIDDPLTMYLEDIFLSAVSLAGLPAVSINCGFATKDGTELPVGMQLIGNHFDETKLLQVAKVYEQMNTWHKKRPEL
ncbi:Asp-tRNA(Asn)/Glu-tRNA(Gln) amidotransferase subunit GatA [Patescibacteria group bacterium]|nr:Asp-tRNA(Asn)/Glu-tRNA(Gln) amidotransferase subunit GatA [Patescibacteria group bacterium]